MPRINMPEIMDSPRCPSFLRDAVTGYLRVMTDLSRVCQGAGPVLRRLLDQFADYQIQQQQQQQQEQLDGGCENQRGGDGAHAAAAPPPPPTPPPPTPPRRVIIDLCSGGGGPLIGLVARGALGPVDEVVLTDLYPNAAAFALAERRLPPGACRGVITAVDAGDVPPELCGGVRTLFNSLHHLAPLLVLRVLADAARQGQPFAAFEVRAQRAGGPEAGALLR
ncbi:hypothetical protein MNEG_12202 [Monoraphidium neglectum]|uniref:Methyltransferase domain-containing protein n=1 Tax=Monoraphidium neglectum TaxID=145388 RepID=A0A0D2M351_9CHLO|nr:hypothetical protein MNEG_12202 [Monoraphidium neglectum]KIY95761.1 hypothetical protein MNEG_12202 [Monoraphidium neglectum]|eukprot:XP_013894781.1 hypothetical protein MNEG_12202 [Monoraphidium neglectum]